MKLRRIEIARFRKLGEPLVMDRLGDGLVVISGDNEEGKSTVLAALKAAFFEHHTVGGTVRDAMVPHRGGVPEIAVGFECGGATHLLRKAFRRGGVVLECAGQRLQDDAAERRLQELLRFERRQARTPRPENAGLQALFWVDQATAFRDFDGIAGGLDRLTAAVAGEVGSVVGGEGARRILATARQRAADHYTPGRQQETGALRAARERMDALAGEHASLDARRRDFEARVDRLARLREERRRLIEQDPAGRARERCEAARRRLGELAELERRLALAVEAVKAGAAELARVEAQLRTREGLTSELARLEGDARNLAERVAAAEREALVLREAARALAQAAGDAGATAAAAEAATATARDRVALARLDADTQRVQEALAQCRAADERRRRALAQLAASEVTPQRVAAARNGQRESETAAARLATVATRVDLRPAPGRRATVAGEPVDPAVPLLLSRTVELELEGFGRLVLTPGGEDLAAREAALNAAKDALAAALAAMGVATLAEAEAALERRRETESELRRAESEVKAILQANGHGALDALAQHLADREAELARLRGRLAADAFDTDLAELEAAAARCDTVMAQAQRAQDAARVAAVEAERRLAAADAALAGLHGERQAASTRLAELGDRLLAERERHSDADLAAAVEAARAIHLAAERAEQALRRELENGDAEGARERLAIAEREVAALDADRRRLDGDIRDLEVALRESGVDGWLDRLAQIEGDLDLARAAHRQLERAGQAWRLLAERLAAADQSAREALVAPIGQRLRPLLQRVFPGAEPELDPERLSLTHLCRDGAREPFDQLSVGAREQVAILVRLAFARLLAEREGEAPCLILDDALVYADEGRFETMKAILQRAARDLQIIVLTCRPRDYFGLEADYRRLEDCRAT
jgi:chromosome segregation ATPase